AAWSPASCRAPKTTAKALALRPDALLFREDLGEPVVRLVRARLHAAAQDRVAVFFAGEHRADPDPRSSVADVLERQRVHADVARHRLELEGLDDTLRRDDLAVLPVEPELVPVRGRVGVAPLAATADVHLVDDGDVTPWPAPRGADAS